MSKKKLITSALPYVNNVPHLGNIIGCVLSADVYARYVKATGSECLYICATDEYGTATENKAREEGLTPKEVCDKYHEIHKKIYQAFNIDFDAFGRTSDPEHTEVTQSIYQGLEDQGYVFEEVSEQTYCEEDQMFLADRYVEGICPFCAYEDARGDQCDQCGKLLQPTELKEPRCKVCGNHPVTRTTKHLYIDLPKLESQIKSFQEQSIEKGAWSHNAVAVSKGWIERGLQPRPITRDLKWGIPVPREGFDNKVFYVWFDAPIGYISATKKAYPDTWKDWWQNPDEVELYQFMAKDNIPFHSVVFPASLLGSGTNWTMLHHLSATEYLTYENAKFSKSRNLGVFGSDVLALDIPIDLWRFYLLYNRPEKSDSNFTWESLVEDVNSNFIDNIGNLLNRVLIFYSKNYTGPLGESKLNSEQEKFLKEIKSLGKEALAKFDQVQLKEALKTILAMGRLGNKMFQDSEPWKVIKEDQESCKAILVTLSYLIHDLGHLLHPYMPETSSKILGYLGIEKVDMNQVGNWDHLKEKTPEKGAILFKKLDPKLAPILKEKFSGEKGEVEEKVDPIEAWKKLKIQVGKITSIEVHPSADRLYVETLDLGNGETRKIVSGLVKYYQPEELLGKKVLVATNLKPANLRGVDSQGMVLAVEKRKKLEVLFTEAELGEEVLIEGIESGNQPEEITIDEFFAIDLTVVDHQVGLEGKAASVGGQVVRTEKLATGVVR